MTASVYHALMQHLGGQKNSAKIPRKTQPTLQKTSANQLPEEREKEKIYIYNQTRFRTPPSISTQLSPFNLPHPHQPQT